MTTSVEPVAVHFDDDSFIVELDDGRTIGVPLAWFPRLFHANRDQRENFYLSRAGIHWEELDEDISVAGLLAGQRDVTHVHAEAA
jgi:hypothetical protein